MPGPRKKLAAIKRLEGNPGCYPIEETGVEALGAPFIPEHLMDDARGCIEVVQQSMPPSVYSRLDSFTLAAFGMAWAIHKRAAFEISNPGFEWTTASSQGSKAKVPSPWLKIMNQQAEIIARLGDRLGLNPTSRAALRLPDAGQKKSKFEGLLGQVGSSSLSSN